MKCVQTSKVITFIISLGYVKTLASCVVARMTERKVLWGTECSEQGYSVAQCTKRLRLEIGCKLILKSFFVDNWYGRGNLFEEYAVPKAKVRS